MRYCKFPGCGHKSWGHLCKMHRFPRNRDVCQIWINACGLQKTPTKIPGEIFLCSCHFVGGAGPTNDNPYPINIEVIALEPEGEHIVDMEECDDPSSDTHWHTAEEVDSSDMRPSTPTYEQQSLSRQANETEWHSAISNDNSQVVIPFDIRAAMFSMDQAEQSASIGESLNETANDAGISTAEFNMSGDENCPLSHSMLSGLSELQEESIHEEESDARASQNKENGVCPACGQSLVPFKMNKPSTKRGSESSTNDTDRRKNQTGKFFNPLPPFQCERCRKFMIPEDFEYFTGMSKDKFEILYDLLGGEEMCQHVKYKFNPKTPLKERSSNHTSRDRLFITLIRLRRGLSLREMEYMFHLSVGRLSVIFYTWVRLLSLTFKSMEHKTFVSLSNQVDPPDCFTPFKNLRCIIDCTEIHIQQPSDLDQQNNTYSAYKGGSTAKFLVAISKYGGLSFISEGAEGSMSDRKVFLRCGIMDYLNEGEAVMSDKGFDIETALDNIGVDLLIPAFIGKRSEFTARELLLNQAVATSRVHVERFIKYMKDYKIIAGVVPATLLDILSDIVRICANLVNFNDPFIKWTHVEDPSKKNAEKK